MASHEKVAIVGLGYVGLPVALAFAEAFPGTVGFDINAKKVQDLKAGHDVTGEISKEDLLASTLKFSSDPKDLSGCSFIVVAVPTPIDENLTPDLRPLASASQFIGKYLEPGTVIVYESTVYPGVTEEVCGPLLEKESGLKRGVDFKLGYSPERINPGDKEHTLKRIIKVVSGEDADTLERVATAYEAIVTAGVYRAPSIKVAEAAKVIENTQRDLNIALVNELAMIFDRLGIRTQDVLAAARTKWNFLPFSPGLVGGHCIGVDPYYLTTKAQQVGYYPQVILAGRRINDSMGAFVAQRLVKMLIEMNVSVKGARVGVLGLTFKENVTDIRNSKVPDILKELKEFGINALIHDPLADLGEVGHEYGLTLSPLADFKNLDALILAVPHQPYLDMPLTELLKPLNSPASLIDLKGVIQPGQLPAHVAYWSL